MVITARQLGYRHELPVHVPYRGLQGRLGGENLFAKTIIAKYASSEEQDLPSADFAYPEQPGAGAEAALSELTERLLVLNRIRIQMNIHNRRILQQFSISVSARCEQLLNELSRSSFFVSGVSGAAVRELREIYRELAEKNSGVSGAPRQPEGRRDEESVLLLRVLTAASRGNAGREQYMRRLVRRLYDMGMGPAAGNAVPLNAAAGTLISRAGREIFFTERVSRSIFLTEWASEQARQFFWHIQRAPEQERQFFLRSAGLTSLVSLEKILKTMDDAAFRNYSAPVLERMTSLLREQGDSGAYGFAADFGDSDVWTAAARAAKEAERYEMQGKAPAELLSAVFTFLEGRNPEEWREFREELIKSGGEEPGSEIPALFREASSAGSPAMIMRKEKEILFRVLREDRDAVRQLRILVLETIQRVSTIRESQKEYVTLTESIRSMSAEQWNTLKEELTVLRNENEAVSALLPAELLHAGGNTAGAAGTELTGPEAGDAAGSTVIMRREKELLFRILREDRDAVRELRVLVLETIRRISVIRENQKEYMTLAESIMNLTSEQWEHLKEDLQSLREEDREIRAQFPADMFLRAGTNSLPAPEALPEEERSFRESGIRMSAEKLVFLKALQAQSLRPDSVLTETGRKLYIRTVLKSTEAGRLIQPSFRELSSEGKEKWREFLSELFRREQNRETAAAGAGLYFGRIAGRYGIRSGTGENASQGTGAGAASIPGAGAALLYLEREREGRIQTPGSKTETTEAPEISASADIAVPSRAAAAGESRGDRSQARQTLLRSGSEQNVDIAFETVTRSSREEERVSERRELKELQETLERHEREITKLVKTQETVSRQDIPKEVIRQLGDRLRMERLRGGL